MSKRPIVLLDVDGPLADFIGGVLPIVQSITGTLYGHGDVDRFDFCAALGLDKATTAKVKRTIGATPGFCESLAVMPGAREGVAAIQRVADVYCVTSPWNSNPSWTYEREAWLSKHFGIHHSNVIHTSAKWLVEGDVFVDDKTDAVYGWSAFHGNGVAIRWNTPHNVHDIREMTCVPDDDLICTSDWARVLELVKGVAHVAA